MDSLFAPWRMEWVQRDRETGEGCIFCALPKGDGDRENLILARGEQSYVLLNNSPYNPGHAMVIPYEHTGQFDGLDETSLLDTMTTSQTVIEVLREGLSSDGFNVGFNLGEAGGASITDHLHMHIIPRWENDTSFMPLTGNTAIVEEAVVETYDRLHEVLLSDKRSAGTAGGGAVSLR